MSIERKKLFGCEKINWAEVEILMEEMSSRGTMGEGQSKVSPTMLVDLPVMETHLKTCEDCKKRFVELAQKYGLFDKNSSS